MTNRSSLDIPPVLTSVAAIVVDILDRSPIVDAKLAPCTGLGRLRSWASRHGNIAVKSSPIRLSAFAPLGNGATVPAGWVGWRARRLLRRTRPQINRFTQADIARLQAIGHQA